MIKNDDKKTSPKQRIFFILVAIFLLATTFMLYAGLVLNRDSDQKKNSVEAQLEERYQDIQARYQSEINEYAKEISKEYFDTFVEYKDKVKAYNAADVTDLATKDYVIGDGDEIEDSSVDTDYSSYYIGWLPDGTIFDSSFDNADNPSYLKFPLDGATPVIQGWQEGVSGMNVGGIRRITMPAVLGYGESGSGIIPANSPLRFIVMLVPHVEQPDMSAELQADYDKFQADYVEYLGLKASTESEGTESKETTSGE